MQPVVELEPLGASFEHQQLKSCIMAKAYPLHVPLHAPWDWYCWEAGWVSGEFYEGLEVLTGATAGRVDIGAVNRTTSFGCDGRDVGEETEADGDECHTK